MARGLDSCWAPRWSSSWPSRWPWWCLCLPVSSWSVRWTSPSVAAPLVWCLLMGAAPGAQSQERPTTVSRTLFGETALELRSTGSGTLLIGAAGPTKTVTLDVRATDVRRWADSAARLIPVRRTAVARKRLATSDSVIRARVVLEEPGVGAGSLILSRADSAGVRTWLLFASDAAFDGVRQPLESEEVATFIKLMRRAALAAAPPAQGRRLRRQRRTPPTDS